MEDAEGEMGLNYADIKEVLKELTESSGKMP